MLGRRDVGCAPFHTRHEDLFLPPSTEGRIQRGGSCRYNECFYLGERGIAWSILRSRRRERQRKKKVLRVASELLLIRLGAIDESALW